MDQKEFERDVFESFATVAPFKIVPETIENRDPPEPDIVCEIEKCGLVGFELTELIDQNFMARLNTMFDTKRHLTDYWKSDLSEEKSNSFKDKYADALIHVIYADSLSFKKRLPVTKVLFEALAALPAGTEGTSLVNAEELSPSIREVRILRGKFVGPILDVDSSGSLGDPTYDTLMKKFAKTYECVYPVELLAHIETDLLLPDGAWMAAVDEAVAQLGKSQFTRLWVFNRTDGSITYEKSR